MKSQPVIYQIALRSFTPEGTLRAAKGLIPFVASLGVDVLYLCPFFREGDDTDISTWSPRQRASNTQNPKNPYKIADYFAVDEEYGTTEDLKDFVREAHLNGLKVLFDLVYLHCDKNAVFIRDNPDFVKRDQDGTVAVGEEWPFARLNFQNQGLRDYLLSNMKTLVEDYDADGFRCDVGDCVPLDFWEDSFRVLRQIKPDLLTLNEGTYPEYLQSAFDLDYGFEWNRYLLKAFSGEITADAFRNYCTGDELHRYGKDIGRLTRMIDSHDIASDSGLNRNETVLTAKGMEAALVLCVTYPGAPFLWNGIEVCDTAENSMFSNRFFGKRSAIDWSRGFTPEGMARTALVRRLFDLRHRLAPLSDGELCWLDTDRPQEVAAYLRKKGETTVAVVVNLTNHPTEVSTGATFGEIFLKSDCVIGEKLTLGPYGYLVAAAE